MTDIWEYLENVKKPIILYGMGNGADKIIKVLHSRGISFDGVFASDGFIRNKTFHGFKIESYSEIKARLGQVVVLLCFGSSRPEVIENVLRISREQELYAPDVPVIGEGLFDSDYVNQNHNQLEKIYNQLEDDASKLTFKSIVEYKLTGKIAPLLKCEADPIEPYKNILKFGDNECFMDLGAYNGDTVLEFTKYVSDYKKIIAVEPDKKSYKKLVNNTSGLENIQCFNVCISDYCGDGCFAMRGGRNSSVSKGEENIIFATADSIDSERLTTYINMDVEGEELKAIRGACEIIKHNKPKMLISCYHRIEDLIAIPEEVFKIRADYKLYMRHFKSTLGWDTVYYFV